MPQFELIKTFYEPSTIISDEEYKKFEAQLKVSRIQFDQNIQDNTSDIQSLTQLLEEINLKIRPKVEELDAFLNTHEFGPRNVKKHNIFGISWLQKSLKELYDSNDFLTVNDVLKLISNSNILTHKECKNGDDIYYDYDDFERIKYKLNQDLTSFINHFENLNKIYPDLDTSLIRLKKLKSESELLEKQNLALIILKPILIQNLNVSLSLFFKKNYDEFAKEQSGELRSLKTFYSELIVAIKDPQGIINLEFIEKKISEYTPLKNSVNSKIINNLEQLKRIINCHTDNLKLLENDEFALEVIKDKEGDLNNSDNLKPIKTILTDSIGKNYPIGTGRLKKVVGNNKELPDTMIALLGDSTVDQGHWTQEDTSYANKTCTTTHQTALFLANHDENRAQSYTIANFAVDGATTKDLDKDYQLRTVLGLGDEDHTWHEVNQLNAVAQWKPDVAVLSVGGNNYRVALRNSLYKRINKLNLLLRITPEDIRAELQKEFQDIKDQLLVDYKNIIDRLINDNPKLSRLVLVSQYYPALTDFTPHFIYTGFSHVARAQGEGKTPFNLVEDTMNELYREILKHAATKEIDIVFADMTSSMNPLAGNHSLQIEPNEEGSKVMGKLIAAAITHPIPTNEKKESIPIIRLDKNNNVETELLNTNEVNTFTVKKVTQFISENRYRHVGLFFSPSTSFYDRYFHAFDMIKGKRFDNQYTGVFAFGLLDASLITIAASYLWRVTSNDNIHASLRVGAGIVAAPIIVIKYIVGLALLALWLYQ